MKRLDVLRTKLDNKLIEAFVALAAFFALYPEHASARPGLDQAKTVLETIKKSLLDIVPVAATATLLCLAIGYAGRFIEKDTFLRWGIGVIIAGSATQITKLLFGTS